MNTQSLPFKANDDPGLFKELIRKPAIAWPTTMLVVTALGILGVSTSAYLSDSLSVF